MAYAYVLFPGRHHLLTRFQAAYLERAVAVGVPDTKGEHADCRGAQVVFGVAGTARSSHADVDDPLPGRPAIVDEQRVFVIGEEAEVGHDFGRQRSRSQHVIAV